MLVDDLDMDMHDGFADSIPFDDMTQPTIDLPSMGNSSFGDKESSFDGSDESHHIVSFYRSFENHGWEHHTHFPTTSSSTDSLDFTPDNNQISSISHVEHSPHQRENIDYANHGNDISFRGGEHTVGERNAAISQAKHDIAEAESDIRHQTNMINSKTRMGESHSAHDSALHSAQNRLAEAKRALNNAYNMKTKS